MIRKQIGNQKQHVTYNKYYNKLQQILSLTILKRTTRKNALLGFSHTHSRRFGGRNETPSYMAHIWLTDTVLT